MIRIRAFGVLSVGALALAAAPLQAAVNVGDPAPPLKIKEWVRGQPVDLAKDASKKLHLVEFWATWCPPCKASVPLLTEIQKKFPNDLVIIGVTDPDPYRNSPTDVRQFVKQQGASMDYTVALDDKGQTLEAYMDTSEGVAIPHAVLVGKDGKVVWQGSPLDPAMEQVIREVAAGRYDVSTAKKAAETSREVEKRFRALEMAFEAGQMNVVWDGAIDIFRVDPANEMAIHLLTGIYVNEEGYADKYRAWATNFIQQNKSDASAMSTLSMALMGIEDFSARAPELAIEAAKAAYDASGKADALAIATYARALHSIGALDRAISLQEEAVSKSPDGQREEARKVLEFYQTCKRLQQSVQ